MNKTPENIHPVFDKVLQRTDKEKLLRQHSLVIWFTGLSGAGKTTLAVGIEQELSKRGYLTQVLDGDNIRTGINNNLGFTGKDRLENIRRIAEVSKLFINCGVITINSFVSPTKDVRRLAKDIIGKENFIEIYVNAPLEVCEKRDVKGLYAKARRGEIKDFTGISAPFEAPVKPDIEIKTDEMNIEESIKKALDYIKPIVENYWSYNEKI